MNNFELTFVCLKYGFMITSWFWIPKNVILWLFEMGATLPNLCHGTIIRNIRQHFRTHHRKQSWFYWSHLSNYMLYSEYRPVRTQINVACWLILLLNLTLVIALLFGCSVIKKSMKEVNKMQLYLLLMQTFFTFIYI